MSARVWFQPGPWKWHPRSKDQEHNGSVYREPIKGHAYAIAMQPRFVSDEQWAADAQLITAAPDLLAALELLISARGAKTLYMDAHWLAANAAISKAVKL